MDKSPLPPDFDPAGAGLDGGLFGLPCTPENSRVVVVPVPFEATVSYGDGTANGPAAVLSASAQVDLFDLETGRPYEAGLALLPLEDAVQVREWSDAARAEGVSTDEANALCERMNAWVRARCDEWLARDRIVFVLGGDHSTPFGCIAAHAERYPGLGVLHVDAHYDLRPAYGGHTWSHASIMRNVLDRLDGVERIVHVGVRDFSEAEQDLSSAEPRSTGFPDPLLRSRLEDGVTWRRIADGIVGELPEQVYLSFDIDGLDPALCPGTGTPVPGGLSWHEVTSLLAAVVRSGRTIVGGDLVEVAPQRGDREWNANVGARLLYKMIGSSLLTQAP